jgi:NAD-dependent histone deacetylase SIR2
VENGSITAKKLLTAFGLQPPVVYEGESDELYYPFLSYAIQREISKRRKLPHINTVDDAVQLLKRSKNVIVLTGAGISTSLGIPDFRSKGTGLYSKLEHLGLNDPQEVFNIEVFREDPTIFYSIAKDIIPSHDRYTPTHAFIRLLQDKGKLLTNYTQNIDNLEQIAGIQEDKLIQCHGSFATASCTKCGHKVPGEVIFPDMRTGRIPRCKRCISLLRGQGASMKRKRSNNSASSSKKKRADYEDSSHSEDNAEPEEAGIMKPDIIFFGEALPDGFGDRLEHHDRDKVDLCIVIGTSLKVAPVSEVVRFLPPDCPQIYISREPVKHCEFDVDLLGDCDIVVSELCRRAGWNLDHEMIPEDQKVGVALEEGFESRWKFLEIAGTHREFKPNEVKTEEKSGESNGLVRRKRKSRSPQDTTTSNSDASH